MRWFAVVFAMNFAKWHFTVAFSAEEHTELLNVDTTLKKTAHLPCPIAANDDTMSPALIIWFKQGITSPIYSVDVRNRVAGAGVHWSNEEIVGNRAFFKDDEFVLTLDNIHERDGGLYKCRVDFTKYPTRNFLVNLTVVVPPRELSIVDASGKSVQMSTLTPIPEGNFLKLVCTAHGGRPPPSVHWWLNEMLMSDESILISGNSVQNILYVEKLQRSHHGSILKCEAFNGNGTNRNAISSVLVLNMYLKPLEANIIMEEPYYSAQKVYDVICVSTGSRPSANITWFIGRTQIAAPIRTVIGPDRNSTKSILTLRASAELNGARITCYASNIHIYGHKVQDSRKIDVHYPPLIRIELGSELNQSNIRHGADAYFDCIVESHPKWTKLRWMHNGKELSPSPGIILSNQTLVLQSISRQSAGNYSCYATNEEGSSTSNTFYLDVKYEPICVPDQQQVYGAVRFEKIRVTCDVDANPQATYFAWKFNNSLTHATDVGRAGGVTWNGARSGVWYQPRSDADYGTLQCWSKNDVGTQSVPCVYHIIAAGKPDSPRNCSVFNATAGNSLLLRCEAGFDGGLQQEFACELLANETERVLLNVTAKEPEFELRDLGRDTSYVAVVYAINSKGRSPQQRVYIESYARVGERRSRTNVPGAGGGSDYLSMAWIVILCAVFVFMMVLFSVAVVTILKCSQKEEASTLDKSPCGSTGGHSHSDEDRNPDVVPEIDEEIANCNKLAGHRTPCRSNNRYSSCHHHRIPDSEAAYEEEMPAYETAVHFLRPDRGVTRLYKDAGKYYRYSDPDDFLQMESVV